MCIKSAIYLNQKSVDRALNIVLFLYFGEKNCLLDISGKDILL